MEDEKMQASGTPSNSAGNSKKTRKTSESNAKIDFTKRVDKTALIHLMSTVEVSSTIETLSDSEDAKADVPTTAPIEPLLSDSSDDNVLDPEEAIKTGRDDEDMRRAWARRQKAPRLQLAIMCQSKVDWKTNIQRRKTGKALIRHKQRRFVASKVAKVLHSLPAYEKPSITRREFFDLGERIAKKHNLRVNDMCPFWSPMVEDYYGIRMEDFPSIGPFQLTGYEYEEYMIVEITKN